MKRKSVGIITVQKSLASHGASLQSFALWSYIQSLGYDCEIIDLYRPVIKGYIDDTACLSFTTCRKNTVYNYLKRIVKCALSFIKQILKQREDILKKQRFETFNSAAKYSRPYKSIGALYNAPPVCDIYVSGSDQIWNSDMPFENEPYMLSFVKDQHKCVSYASSFGRDNVPEIYKSFYSKYLQRYKSISVREISGSFIIDQLIGRKAIVVLDPTMLFDGNYWHSFTVQPTMKKKYLLCFSLNHNKELIKYASKISKKKGLVLVSFYRAEEICKCDYINASDSGPKEWLGWIENADFVITDSFHATAFSILFRRPFCSYIKRDSSEANRGSRIENLLAQLSLDNCLLNDLNSDTMDYENLIDYEVANFRLDTLRTLSKNYLNEALR